MTSTDTTLKNMPHPKIHQPRIVLVAGTILLIVTLLVGVSVFMLMQRHAEALLSKSLQSSLQSRIQLTETEIRANFDSTVLIATRPLLIDQLQHINARTDDTVALNKLNVAARSFLQTGLTALTFYGEDGQELVRTGVFAQQPELAVPLNLPGHAQLLWDGQLLLRAVVDMKKDGRVIGKVMTESSLPATTGEIMDASRLGETGELALCAPFGLKLKCFPTVLNPKTFTPSQRTPEGVRLPMAHALEGDTGFIVTKDYRNQEVTAAYAPVGDLGLGMVLKMDSAELHAPVWDQLRLLIPLLLGMFVIALLLLRWRLTPLVLRLTRSEAQAAQRNTALTNEVTERKRITEALRASEAQLRQITDTVPVLIADLDLEQRFRFHNKAYEEVFGLSFEQIRGHTVAEVLGPQTYGRVQDKVEEVLRGHPVSYERTLTTSQGDLRDYAMNYLPRYGEGADEGKVVGFYAQGTDITELKRIDRMKTEFVSTVSHELRTPLTSIRGSLGLIAGGVAGELPEAVKNLVDIAKNNCDRLIRLINDMLDVEKIESGTMHLILQVVDIRPLLQQALAANQGFAGQHRVTTLLQVPDEPLQVRIDSDRLSQVLTNLLSNACKFSPPEGAVEVRVSRVGQQVRVEVADHGPGIAEEFKSRIFQKFSQADSSDTRQKGGTGLGLSISKALIETMGGQIGFNSEAGAGTTFFFEIPEWSKPRILHVEDDPITQRMVAKIGAGFADFEFTATLDQARARLREQRFDLVLLDLTLGQDSGWDLLEAIAALDPRPPVIVFSASYVAQADGQQVEAVLLKAHTSNADLLHTIQRALQISGDPDPKL